MSREDMRTYGICYKPLDGLTKQQLDTVLDILQKICDPIPIQLTAALALAANPDTNDAEVLNHILCGIAK